MSQLNKLFTWSSIFKMALEHRKNFAVANIVAVIKTLLYLPVPLIIPSLINEVLLKQPGFFTKMLSRVLPEHLITSGLILITAFTLVLTLRFCVQILGVLQGLEFKTISKDVVLHRKNEEQSDDITMLALSRKA